MSIHIYTYTCKLKKKEDSQSIYHDHNRKESILTNKNGIFKSSRKQSKSSFRISQKVFEEKKKLAIIL